MVMAEAAKLGDAVEGMAESSRKNQQEIVIDFLFDRVLHYVGVYLVAFIAVIAKISELAAPSISCYPAGNISVGAGFIKYANSYCWESPNVISSNSSYNGANQNTILIDNAATFMTIFRVLPYVMLLEAALYAIPYMFWHGLVGARLMGHLKFIRNLLTDIYEALKLLPTGEYKTCEAKLRSYDRDGYYLNGCHGFDPIYVERERQRQENDEGEEGTELLSSNRQVSSESNSCIFGRMHDRHFFSMLCFENFSSLEHHPFILSVYKLTPGARKGIEANTFPMMKAMLILHCHPENFRSRFLVKAYLCRHAIGATTSLAVVIAMCIILLSIRGVGWSADSFRCDIPFHDDVDMICTIIRRVDMIAYLAVNLAVSIVYFLISISRIVYIRMSSDRAVYHYFEEINATGSVALEAAARLQYDRAR